MKSGGFVERNFDFLALKDFYHFFVFDVFALEDGGENHKRMEFALASEYYYRQLTVLAVLLGRNHHAAAVIATFHSRRQPDVFVNGGYAVDGNGSGNAFKMEQQSFDGYAGIIDFFIGRGFSYFVCDFTAIPVNSVADAVNKFFFDTVNVNGGKVFNVFVDTNGIFRADVGEKSRCRCPRDAGKYCSSVDNRR